MEELSIVGELPIQCFRLLPGVLLDRVRDAKSGSKQPSATTLHLAFELALATFLSLYPALECKQRFFLILSYKMRWVSSLFSGRYEII